jgi:Haem-binding uptake, Tiki superfamily, ChaN
MMTKFLPLLLSIGLLGIQQAPRDARRELLKAWEQHRIVAVSEAAHRSVEDKDFLLTVIRDAEFSQRVNDIVVEFGNARLQPVLDRYMAGAAVSRAELRQVWGDTTVVNGMWDAPVYEQFFAAVRDHNQTLPANRRLRVIACDPPIDWQRVKTIEDAAPFLSRDPFCASVLEREVIAKGRRALLIMGDMHVSRRHPTGRRVENVVNLIEAKHPGAVFVALTYAGQYKDSAAIEEQLGGGPIPSVSLLRTSPIGKWLAAPPKPLTRTRVGPAAAPVSETIVVTDPPPFEDVADALIYLGPKSTFTRSVPSEDRFSPEEMRELDRRHQLLFKSPLDRKVVFQ